MTRYIRLYMHFVRFSFSKAMEFRVDFFFRVVMDLIFYVIQFAFFSIIYLHTPLLAGWDEDQMKLFIAGFIFVDAFHMTFFANNSWWFPISVNKGDLDYYLARPASSFFFVAFKEIAANSFLNLIFAVILLSYILATSSISFTLSQLLIYILLLINGAVLYYIIYLIFLLPVFWTGSPRGFGDLFYSAEKVYQKPDGIFKGASRKVFTTILPFAMIASFPTRFMIEQDNQISIFLQIIAASMAVYLAFSILWKRGMRNYTSASS